MKHLDMSMESCVECPFLQEAELAFLARYWNCFHPKAEGNTVVSEKELDCEHMCELEEDILKQKHPSGFPHWCPLDDVIKGGRL